MVIRVICVPDSLDLTDFDEVFRTVLGWDGLGFIFQVHGQEFNSFRRVTRSKTLRDFQLRPRETFLYTCGAIDLWEWEFRLLDQEPGDDGDEAPVCLGGRGAAPPGTLRRPHWISADAEVAKARRGNVHTRADGGGDWNVLRCRSARARQYLADAAASVARWFPKHRSQAARNTDPWSQNASACKKPTSA
jgi:hypothetical protein